MPGSMLISRRRRVGGDQLSAMANSKSVTNKQRRPNFMELPPQIAQPITAYHNPNHNDDEDDSPSSLSDEDDAIMNRAIMDKSSDQEDEDQLDADLIMTRTEDMREQMIGTHLIETPARAVGVQHLQTGDTQPVASGSNNNQQLDLTNAILYFMNVWNQQQQHQQPQPQQQSQSQQSSASNINVANATGSGIQRLVKSEQSLISPVAAKLSPGKKKIRPRPGQAKTKLTPLRVGHISNSAIVDRRSLAPATKISLEVAKHHFDEQQQLREQPIFLDAHEVLQVVKSLSDDRTSSKRSSSGSGSGTGDNFVHYCQDCKKRYSTSSNLARHRQTHRDVTDKKAKKCPECDKIYVSMPAFSMHLRTHSQGCICSICGKSFSRPWLLQGHMRTHTGEKPFKCKICDKAFADKSNLRAHIQTHSSTKPHVCERCNKAFALKSYLCKHVESTCMRQSGSQKEPLNLKVINQSRRGRLLSSSQ